MSLPVFLNHQLPRCHLQFQVDLWWNKGHRREISLFYSTIDSVCYLDPLCCGVTSISGGQSEEWIFTFHKKDGFSSPWNFSKLRPPDIWEQPLCTEVRAGLCTIDYTYTRKQRLLWSSALLSKSSKRGCHGGLIWLSPVICDKCRFYTPYSVPQTAVQV